jgi:iron complex transport system substrate-binding protein
MAAQPVPGGFSLPRPAHAIVTPLGVLVAVLLLSPALAGCLGPGLQASGGDCLSPLQMPQRLPDVEARATESGLELRDTTGVWTLIGDLERIVPTSHDLVELLFLMGHGERVVAVPGWIDHPPGPHPEGIEGLERLGRPHVIPAEDVHAQDPTLVLDKPHPLQPTPLAQSLRAANIPTIVFDTQETLGSLALTYATVGAILSTVDNEAPAKAQALWDDLRTQIEDIHNTIKTHLEATGAGCPRALYMFPSSLTAGKGTTGGLTLELAGAENLAATLGMEGYLPLSREALTAADPERVVGTTTGGLPVPEQPRWAPTQAAKYGREAFLGVHPAITGLTGPRYAEGVLEVAKWLHPQAFGLIEPHIETTIHENNDNSQDLTIDASASNAQDGPLRYRLILPDEPAQQRDDGRFTLKLPADSGAITAQLLLIDTHDRIHIETLHIEASP